MPSYTIYREKELFEEPGAPGAPGAKTVGAPPAPTPHPAFPIFSLLCGNSHYIKEGNSVGALGAPPFAAFSAFIFDTSAYACQKCGRCTYAKCVFNALAREICRVTPADRTSRHHGIGLLKSFRFCFVFRDGETATRALRRLAAWMDGDGGVEGRQGAGIGGISAIEPKPIPRHGTAANATKTAITGADGLGHARGNAARRRNGERGGRGRILGTRTE